MAGSTFGHFFSGYDTTPVELRGMSSGCFLATVELGGGGGMTWKVRKLLGDTGDNVPESCSSLIYHERHSKLVVAGHSERHGFMEELYNDALLQEATAYGFLLDIDVPVASANNNSNNNIDPLHLVGGRVLQSSRVNYPLAVTSRASDSWVYVASQETDSVRKVDLGVDHVGNTFTVSAEVDPMRYLSYVGNYRLVLSRYQVRDTPASEQQHLQHSLTSGWSQIYAIRDAPVHVAGIAEVGGVIIVAGTTNGTSPVFGGDEPILGAGSLDGYLSKFNKDTGRPIKNHPKNSHRIQSLDSSHEWIAGMCYTEQDNDHVYIIGATEGKLDVRRTGASNTESAAAQKSVEAFVMKVNVETLEEVWIRQIGAHSITQSFTETRGVDCVVEGKSLWIGGIVQDGAVLRDAGTTESYGNDDVFVAKLKAEDGIIDFVRQIGSTEDDSLAMRGALALDKYGNCIVVGSTYGNLYRKRMAKELEDQPWISDVFVTIINGANGAMSQPVSHPEYKGGQNGRNHAASPNSGHQGNTAPINRETSRVVGRTEMVVIILMGLGLLAITTGYYPKRRTINRDVSTLRGDVIKYLHDFDVNDIDLKHSATGGWHCSYANDLANGVNTRPPRRVGSITSHQNTTRGNAHGDDPLLTVPLKGCDSGASRTRDSLLMADDEMDGLRRDGLGNSFELGDADASQNLGYDGLVEAYNSSWEETRIGSRGWGKDII